MHYQRWWKHGDPSIVKSANARTPDERFWAKVDKNGPIPEHRPDLGNCWVWTAYKFKGYGQFGLAAGKIVLASHFAYGKPIAGELDHLCSNPPCVRPSHLEDVSHLVNVSRRIPGRLGTYQRAKTHCPKGHPYDAANTMHYRGERICKTCRSEYKKRRRQALRASKLLASP